MKDMFKQRWEQIQNLRLKKTGKQKNCVRQKGDECSNCNSKTVQNNELATKLLPAPTDYQLMLHFHYLILPISGGTLRMVVFKYLVLFQSCFLSECGYTVVRVFPMGWWAKSADALYLCFVILSHLQQVSPELCWLASLLLALCLASGFPTVQPLQMEVRWDPGGLTSLHPSGL